VLTESIFDCSWSSICDIVMAHIDVSGVIFPHPDHVSGLLVALIFVILTFSTTKIV
jgi:hypothetical protein